MLNFLNRFFIIIPAAAALAAAAITAGITGKNLRISENLKKGKECYQNQQYEMAVEYFNNVLDDDNKSIEAYYFKTNALLAENNYKSAAAVVEFGYKMTKSDVLDELRNEIIVKPDSAPESANQPVVSNIIPDDIPQNTYSFTFQTADETIFNNKNIDIMPDVKIPDYIPPKETTVPDIPEKPDIPENTDIQSTDTADNTDIQSTDIPENTDIQITDTADNNDIQSTDIPENTDIQITDIPDNTDTQSTDIPENTDIQITGIPDNTDTQPTDTSSSAMLNIDGSVTPEEYQIYESLIDKIIDKIFDRIIEYITQT